jgi:hypothetical protein
MTAISEVNCADAGDFLTGANTAGTQDALVPVKVEEGITRIHREFSGKSRQVKLGNAYVVDDSLQFTLPVLGTNHAAVSYIDTA